MRFECDVTDPDICWCALCLVGKKRCLLGGLLRETLCGHGSKHGKEMREKANAVVEVNTHKQLLEPDGHMSQNGYGK